MTDFKINIDNKISPRTSTNINTIIQNTLSVEDILVYIDCDIPETIDANIKIDIQLDIHFSVISSPIHISKTEPTIIAKPANTTVEKDVVITGCHQVFKR